MQNHHEHTSLNRLALSATLHCLIGCGIGEVSGLTIGTALGWSTVPTIALAVLLAFIFGYAMTLRPLLRSGMPAKLALRIAFAADTVSITIMEIIDNTAMLLIPGAMNAGLGNWLFWTSMIASLIIAAIVVFPVNR